MAPMMDTRGSAPKSKNDHRDLKYIGVYRTYRKWTKRMAKKLLWRRVVIKMLETRSLLE